MKDKIICKFSIKPLHKKVKNNIKSLKDICMKKFIDLRFNDIDAWLSLENKYIDELPKILQYDMQMYLMNNYIEDKYGSFIEKWIYNAYKIESFDDFINIKKAENVLLYDGSLHLFELINTLPIPNIITDELFENISCEIEIDTKDKVDEINKGFFNLNKKYYLSPNFKGIISINTIIY